VKTAYFNVVPLHVKSFRIAAMETPYMGLSPPPASKKLTSNLDPAIQDKRQKEEQAKGENKRNRKRSNGPAD
jgi:hypothetical protein